MPSCREVAALVASDRLDELGALRRLLIRLHLLGCDHCRRYTRELRAAGAALRRLAQRAWLDPTRLLFLKGSIRAAALAEGGWESDGGVT
ncbi:MAG: anti-sigma factor [Gemmatimonadales bacterium]